MRAIALGDIIAGKADYVEVGAAVDEKAQQSSAKADKVNSPSHYTAGKVECIDGIEAACAGLQGFEGYCTGNAIKYLWRWKHKNGREDLLKAAWYINRLLEVCDDPR